MAKGSRDNPLDLLRDAETVRRAAVAAAAAAAAGAAAKKTLDLRAAAHAPEADRKFALHSGEPLAAGLRRVARGQIDTAAELLSPRNGSLRDNAVHDSRKALKRLRALTRLLRGELGEERYRLENEALRDAGRRLSGARDAEVLVDTLDEVFEKQLHGAQGAGSAALRAELVVDRGLARERLLDDAGATESAAREIRAVRGRASHWVRPEAGFDAVAPGLDRIYRQGRRRMRRAAAKPTTENLHDWRKRVKDLRHAAEVLAPANPKRMRKLARRADRLGETLGTEHDLAVLAELVGRRRELFADRAEHRALERAIAQRRERLRRSAFRRGRKLYRRRPRRLVRRIARDWRATQA